MYYIYHIPGVKIGCTMYPKKRINKRQNVNDYIILEIHTDIDIASNREIELQKKYGYRLDRISYKDWIKTCSTAGKIGGKIAVKTSQLKKVCAKGGKIAGKLNGKKAVESGQLMSVYKIGLEKSNEKIQCIYCNKIINRKNHGRWHGEKCKNKI